MTISGRLPVVFACAFLILIGCSQSNQEQDAGDVPAWSQEAIWYQIFVERFKNGDATNDPRLADIEGSWPHLMPEGFETTRWTQDWFEQEDWARASGEPFYLTVQSRRYGGDLQGVIDKLDYLDSLGVTALYLNPINDAPSLHKFDARTYRHIDRNFGPDPSGDLEMMSAENPVDPSTWGVTSADALFFDLINQVHARGMKIIIDVSWNHTGIEFWAWKDILERGADSPYADWYRIEQHDDPATEENEFSYRGWAGVAELPELRKVGVPDGYDGGPVDGNLNPGAKEHIFNVTARWLDPDGDGDPSDGIDGFRLDVAEKVPLGFWKDYREFVRSINPEAYLVGEIWWEEWPSTMLDPKPWLENAFDAVMHYRWYMPTRSLFSGAEPPLSPSQWIVHMDSVEHGIAAENMRSFMNLTASHDSPRFTTSMQNRHQYKYDMNRRDNTGLQDSRPDERTIRDMELLLVQQYTWKGSPHIWNGDELGMWGGDDPDNRKPVWWPEMSFDPERVSPEGESRLPQEISGDSNRMAFYQELNRMRRDHASALVWGAVENLEADDNMGLLSYQRAGETMRIQVIFNLSSESRPVSMEPGKFLIQVGAVRTAEPGGAGGRFELAPRSAVVFLLD